jgi:hypothetical protein
MNKKKEESEQPTIARLTLEGMKIVREEAVAISSFLGLLGGICFSGLVQMAGDTKIRERLDTEIFPSFTTFTLFAVVTGACLSGALMCLLALRSFKFAHECIDVLKRGEGDEESVKDLLGYLKDAGILVSSSKLVGAFAVGGCCVLVLFLNHGSTAYTVYVGSSFLAAVFYPLMMMRSNKRTYNVVELDGKELWKKKTIPHTNNESSISNHQD